MENPPLFGLTLMTEVLGQHDLGEASSRRRYRGVSYEDKNMALYPPDERGAVLGKFNQGVLDFYEQIKEKANVAYGYWGFFIKAFSGPDDAVSDYLRKHRPKSEFFTAATIHEAV